MRFTSSSLTRPRASPRKGIGSAAYSTPPFKEEKSSKGTATPFGGKDKKVAIEREEKVTPVSAPTKSPKGEKKKRSRSRHRRRRPSEKKSSRKDSRRSRSNVGSKGSQEDLGRLCQFLNIKVRQKSPQNRRGCLVPNPCQGPS